MELLNTQGLVFGRRLFDWRTREAERDAAIRAFVLASERPVFFTSERKPSPGLGVRYHGFLTELVPGGAAIELQLDPRQPRLFEELMRHASRDPWERSRRAQLISTFGKYLGLAVLTGDPGLLERLGPSIARAEGSFFGLIGMADTLMEHGDPAHHGRIEDLLGRAEPLAGEAEYPEPLARFAYLKGFLRHRLGDPAARPGRCSRSRPGSIRIPTTPPWERWSSSAPAREGSPFARGACSPRHPARRVVASGPPFARGTCSPCGGAPAAPSAGRPSRAAQAPPRRAATTGCSAGERDRSESRDSCLQFILGECPPWDRGRPARKWAEGPPVG